VPELLSAVGNARGRDMEAVALKNSKKAELIALLIELAAYVTLTVNRQQCYRLLTKSPSDASGGFGFWGSNHQIANNFISSASPFFEGCSG
jgi:hypothetical protein